VKYASPSHLGASPICAPGLRGSDGDGDGDRPRRTFELRTHHDPYLTPFSQTHQTTGISLTTDPTMRPKYTSVVSARLDPWLPEPETIGRFDAFGQDTWELWPLGALSSSIDEEPTPEA
jgi:hypothetical protein